MTVRRRPWAPVLLVAVVAVLVAVFLTTLPTRHFFDLGVYRGAVRYWLVDGGDLYDFHYQNSAYGFTYPPFAALVFSPFAATSWPVAVAVGLAVNSAMVILLLRWYLVPILRRRIWTWSALAFLAVVVFEPARDTFSYGQINLVLLVLVCWDLRNGRWSGVGVGLAAAIKLTPALFIGYLLLTRRYRAAAVAAGTAAAATLIAALIAPDASRAFWTDALWNTGRVGRLEYVSNQSLRGVLARLDAPAAVWLAAAALVLAYWCWWIRTRSAGDDVTGFAVTGIVTCLISPITWVHHLVWLMPALFLLLGRALAEPDPVVRRRQLGLLAAGYVVMSSSIVWLWWAHPRGWAAFPGSNAYVWMTLTVLIVLTRSGKASTEPGAPTRPGRPTTNYRRRSPSSARARTPSPRPN